MTDRKPLMAGNWKMNLNHFEAIALVQKLAFGLNEQDLEAVEVAVLTPLTFAAFRRWLRAITTTSPTVHKTFPFTHPAPTQERSPARCWRNSDART